jgi:hypothetical protein
MELPEVQAWRRAISLAHAVPIAVLDLAEIALPMEVRYAEATRSTWRSPARSRTPSRVRSSSATTCDGRTRGAGPTGNLVLMLGEVALARRAGLFSINLVAVAIPDQGHVHGDAAARPVDLHLISHPISGPTRVATNRRAPQEA